MACNICSKKRLEGKRTLYAGKKAHARAESHKPPMGLKKSYNALVFYENEILGNEQKKRRQNHANAYILF